MLPGLQIEVAKIGKIKPGWPGLLVNGCPSYFYNTRLITKINYSTIHLLAFLLVYLHLRAQALIHLVNQTIALLNLLATYNHTMGKTLLAALMFQLTLAQSHTL